MPLVGLTREGVQAVLQAAGGGALQFATDEGLLDQVLRVTVYDEARPELGADTMFVRFLAEDAAAGNLAPNELAKMPSQIIAYLDDWWQKLKAEFGEQGNRKKHQQAMVDLVGTLAAALGPINQADLETINPSLVSDIEQDFVDTVVQAVHRIVVCDSRGDYTLVHPRLRVYLRQTAVKADPYVERLLEHCSHWGTHHSRYALMYYAAHLAGIAAKATGPERHATIVRLVDLVSDEDFQQAHLDKVRDTFALQADLERALSLAAADDDLQALQTLVKSGLALVRFRHDKLRPEPIFDLARRGDVETAQRWLKIFEVDASWRRVILLEIAWLAAETGEAGSVEKARRAAT